MITFDDEKQKKEVADLYKEESEDLARSMSKQNGIGYTNLAMVTINSDAFRVIPEQEARDAFVAAFELIGKKIRVGVLAPENPKTSAAITKLEKLGYSPTLFVVSRSSLEKAWALYKELSFSSNTKAGAIDISDDQINTFLKQVQSLEDVKKLTNNLLAEKGHKISNLLEILLAGALALNASDLHTEPGESVARIRYRLDGVLTDIVEFDPHTYSLLLSRLKLLAGMRLNTKGAQDGRFSIILEKMEIEIRASVLPTAYSESVVLRILNPKSIEVPLESMGIPPKLLEILNREVNKPEGMILTTGPTGSGKTTTLYAFLKKVYTPEIKIITIENPIEYHLAGIVQTQTDSKNGYTFIEGLRAALRQDPDIIMVGEIRDSETAEIAVNSALTGHLVFSTLHTNNAAGTFPRLIDLGVNPKIITSALSVSMAQAAVRKLCPECRKEVPLTDKNKALIQKIVASIKNPDDHIDHVPEKIYEPVGCAKCNFTGYKGRIGIYGAILRSEKIEQAVLENPSGNAKSGLLPRIKAFSI